MSYSNKLKDYPYYQDDKKVVMEEVSKNGIYLEYAVEELKKDKDVVFAAVRSNPDAIRFVSKKFLNDEELFKIALDYNGLLLEYASNKLKDNRNLCFTAVRKNGLALQFVSKTLKDDKEFVLSALLNNGEAIQYASHNLKNDEEACLVALNNSGTSLKYMPEVIKNNEDMALTAVIKNGKALEFVSETLKKQKNIVLQAVKKDGLAIAYAPASIRNDDDVVNAALKQDIHALEHLQEYSNDFFKMSQLLITTKQFVALNYIGEDLSNNKNFALICASLKGDTVQYFSEEIKNDREVLWIAVNQDCAAYEYASKELKKDYALLNAALDTEKILRDVYKNQFNDNYNRADSILMFADTTLKNDITLVKKAVDLTYLALEFASNSINNNIDFVTPIIDKNPRAIEFVGSAITDNADLMKKYCLQYPCTRSTSGAEEMLSNRLKNDEEFILELMNCSNNNIYLLRSCGKKLTDNKNYMLSLIEYNPDAFQFASVNLRNDVDVVDCTIKNRSKTGLKIYEIENNLGTDIKKEIGSTPLQEYCAKKILATTLEEVLEHRPVENKFKL